MAILIGNEYSVNGEIIAIDGTFENESLVEFGDDVTVSGFFEFIDFEHYYVHSTGDYDDYDVLWAFYDKVILDLNKSR
jgi:hypothetical protein